MESNAACGGIQKGLGTRLKRYRAWAGVSRNSPLPSPRPCSHTASRQIAVSMWFISDTGFPIPLYKIHKLKIFRTFQGVRGEKTLVSGRFVRGRKTMFGFESRIKKTSNHVSRENKSAIHVSRERCNYSSSSIYYGPVRLVGWTGTLEGNIFLLPELDVEIVIFNCFDNKRKCMKYIKTKELSIIASLALLCVAWESQCSLNVNFYNHANWPIREQYLLTSKLTTIVTCSSDLQKGEKVRHFRVLWNTIGGTKFSCFYRLLRCYFRYYFQSAFLR